MKKEDIHYLLCAEPRSGTNLLRHLLRSYQLGVPSEIDPEDLGLGGIPANYPDKNILWKHNFLRSHHHASPTGISIFSRCVWSFQFNILMDNLKCISGCGVSGAEVLFDLYPNIKFLYLYRQDIVKQAISMEKSRQTGQWISSHEISNPSPEYNFGNLSQEVVYRMDSQLVWDNILNSVDINPFMIEYTDLCKSPTQTILDIKKFLGMEDNVTISDGATSKFLKEGNAPQRQGDHINKEWESLFYRDLDRLKTMEG